ncbi:MAG: hypothetical protein WBE75_02200 [Candidatus Omnitrophota bacterium]
MGRPQVLMTVVVCSSLFLTLPLIMFRAEGEDNISVKEARCVFFKGEDTLIVGGKDAVWVSVNNSGNWDCYGRTNGIKGEVRALAASADALFAASSEGVYCSRDNGKNWRRVCRARGAVSVLCVPKRIFAATERGLTVSEDEGRHWVKVRGELSSMSVSGLAAAASGVIYLAAEDGIYKSTDTGDTWERILACGFRSEEKPQDDTATQEEYPSGEGKPAFIAAAPGVKLYAYCRGRVYFSADGGDDWQELSSQGLAQYPLRALSAGAGGAVYATDGNGVFRYSFSSGIWVELPVEAGSRRINNIAVSPRGAVYLLCDNGVLGVEDLPPSATSGNSSLSLEPREEPGIQEVQKTAVALADAGQEKITRWRKQAAARGWLPKVSLSTQRNGTDLWHWEGGSTTRLEDDCLRKGKYTQEWSVTVNWELGDLIWSTDQTSIDVRSKLTAELRQDIIEQITKAYFERLRLRHDLENMRLEDRGRRFDKEIRLRELTAYLDAMSGGLYSRKR